MPALRFLVADPSRALQTFMQKTLAEHGFEPQGIRCIDSPHAALPAAQELKPDFLLTDWFADSELTGIELHKKICAINANCRFALLSNPLSTERARAAEGAGALFVLGKPCSAQELRGALGKAIATLAPNHSNLPGYARLAPGTDVKEKIALANRVVAKELPKLSVGQQVMYRGRRDKVKYVILRRGEMVVQLHNHPDLIHASEVQAAL